MSRASLLAPPPEMELAAKLLDAAADAILLGRLQTAATLVAQSDLSEIGQYARRLVGKMSVEVHRHTRRPKCLPRDERDPARMPSPDEQVAIFSRDGWRCRFCGVKVVCKRARSTLVKLFNLETHWTSAEFQRHSALYAMASSLDHVVPHGRGGKNEVSNFVTACYCCQFGRGEWLLSEVELDDPRARPPNVDAWDGLTRLGRTRPRDESRFVHGVGNTAEGAV
jgi:hypothetical protein